MGKVKKSKATDGEFFKKAIPFISIISGVIIDGKEMIATRGATVVKGNIVNNGWPNIKSPFVSPYSHIIGEVEVEKTVIISADVFIAGDICCPVKILPGVFIGEGVKIFSRNYNGRQENDQGEMLMFAPDCFIAPTAIICGPSLIGDRVYVGCGAKIINSCINVGCYIGHGSIVEDVKVPAGRSIPNNTTINRQDVADALPLLGKEERKQIKGAKGHFIALYKLLKKRKGKYCYPS